MTLQRLTMLLQEVGVVDATALARAVQYQAREGGTLPRALAALGLASEETVCEALARGLRVDYVSLEAASVDEELMANLPPGFCRERLALPLASDRRGVRLAMAEPLNYRTVQDVEFRTGRAVHVVLASETTVRSLLERREGAHADEPLFDILSGAVPSGEVDVPSGEATEKEAKGGVRPPIVRLVNMILSEAARVGASDVHVEPQEDHLQIRRRIDGLLEDVLRIPREYRAAVTSRFKIIAGMDIAERRRPQDGRSTLRLGDEKIDLRLSSLPTQFGEKIVVRLLDNRKTQLTLEALGLATHEATTFRSLLRRPQGMILVTGPTGSGKTSTLYAALNWLKSPVKNIITVEDPVEYQLTGINQVPINARAGVTFASGLRSILRQDPNVVLVGEVRDQETANIALEAAQTGHLLLSTLHTNDAPGTITRLFDLGVEPFLVASSLIGILAQRLVRRPCPECAKPTTPTDEEIKTVGGRDRLPSDVEWKAGVGCGGCAGSGFKGRIAVHELMTVNDEIRELITRRASEEELREAAQRAGMLTLTQDGIAKAARGQTTLSEVVRVVPPDSASVNSASGRPSTSRPTPGPVAHRAAEPAMPADETPAPDKARIVVVEDSPTIAAVVRYFLELEGFDVHVAVDGTDGLACAQQQPFDVVITDVNMPGMDGIAMVRALRDDPRTARVAVVMLTEDRSIERETEAFSVGADAYLLKPVEPRRLAAHVRAVLKRAGRATEASRA